MDNASHYLKEAKAELEKAESTKVESVANILIMASIANSLICIADVLCKGVVEVVEAER